MNGYYRLLQERETNTIVFFKEMAMIEIVENYQVFSD